jgi:tetratricopeptide (TPR) repeat protein
VRLIGIICGTLLTGYGLLETFESGNQNSQRLLCRLWGCWNEAVVEDAYREFLHGPASTKEFSADLVQALVHDAASSYRWCDVGEALLAAGDQDKAAYCMRRAIALGPRSAPVLLRAANFDFRIGDDSEALQLLARVLKLAPEYDAMVFSDFERFGGGVDRVLQSGLPSEVRSAQAFFRYLIHNRRDAGDTMKTWNWLSARSLTDDQLSVEYVNYLVGSRQIDQAVEVWLRALGRNRGDYMRPNRIFNGDFEAAPSGAALDWTVSVPEGVRYSWDTNEYYSGKRSLRLDFAAQDNLSFNHVYQQAAVKPGLYRFEAHVKAAGITTDQGVSFHIVDSDSPAHLDLATDPVTGTTGWVSQEKVFTVPLQTRLLRIEVHRSSSRKFDNKIAGTLWIDSVKLYAVP